MNRRGFFGALAAVAVAPATARADIPDAVRYSHVAYGTRPYGSIGPYVEWRGRVWWVDDRANLRWAFAERALMEQNQPDVDWLTVGCGIRSIAPHDDVLWIHTFNGDWAQLTFDERAFLDTLRVRVVARG